MFAAILASIKCSRFHMTALSLLSLDAAEARIGRPLTPLSVAGVHRRAHRRGYSGGYYGTGVGVVGCRSRRDGGVCRGLRVIGLSGVGTFVRVRRCGRGTWPQ